MRRFPALLGVSLVLGAWSGRADASHPFPLTFRERFDGAEKVLLGKVRHFAGDELPPDRGPRNRYRYQVLWVEDVEVFKGPPQPDRGFSIVMLPYAEAATRRFSPHQVFDGPLTPHDLPADRSLLLFLERDAHGTWRVRYGSDGVRLYPGATRLEQLRQWARTAPRTVPPPELPGRRPARTGIRKDFPWSWDR